MPEDAPVIRAVRCRPDMLRTPNLGTKISAMANDVKEVSLPGLAPLSAVTSKRYSFLWFVFFLLMIGLVVGVLLYLIAVPLCLLGRIYEPLWALGGRVLCFGVSVLLNLEPWLDADLVLELPTVAGVVTGPFVTVSNHRSH